ncbi:titin-like isoform X2 [Eriocheir sinensis]|uniref:titin-like isoform X2 n=1 Tax=Eriocheir sinensis TaxID=95602 RepID=UPI0021C667BB|nr:titin-like isoform X2 [Eriocheir sinensis]
MSSFWSNVTGRGSGDKPPSGRSRSVSHSKDGEPSTGRPATRERPQDDTRENDDPEKQGDGCLNMSRLAGQMLGRSGGRGVLRVGLLPAFSRAGKTGSLPHQKRQASAEPPGLSTPTPPPTPTEEHHPPVPDSPKPKVKGVGRKRAASASPTRDKRRSFRGISRDRLPPLPHLPHLPHLPSLPPQIRNFLHLGGGEGGGGPPEVPSPNKPSRRPGPVGRTWVKVYDDITFMDEQKEEEEMYPMLGYTGRPIKVPDACPLPTPPTPPPPRAQPRRPSTVSEYDNLPKEEPAPEPVPEPELVARRSPSPEPLADASEPLPSAPPEEPKESVGQGRGRDRFRGKRQKRTGTPVAMGRGEHVEEQSEELDAARLAALEAAIVVTPQEEDYIIPQALQPPRPSRRPKTYDILQGPFTNETPLEQVSREEPLKPRRGVKVYDELIFRRQHQLGASDNTLPRAPGEEAVKEQEVLSQQVTLPEQAAALQQEAAPEQESVQQQEAVAPQEAVPQQEAVASHLETEVKRETTGSEEAAAVTETLKHDGEPPRPRRGLKIYESVDMRRRSPARHAPLPEAEVKVSETIRQDDTKGGQETVAEEPQRPSRGHKIYASVEIHPQREGGQAVVAEVTQKDGMLPSTTPQADSSEAPGVSTGEGKTGSEGMGQEQQQQEQQDKEKQEQQQQEQQQQQQQQQQPVKAAQDPEKVPTVPQTALKFQEGKTLFETTVKIGDEQQQPQQDDQQQQQQPEQQQQPSEEAVPPYARVLKGSGTRELRPLVTSDDDEPPPPIPPKKKGLRTISPQLEELFPPRPPRHLKPRVTTSVLMVNGEVMPERPARGSKIYETIKETAPMTPKRYPKVVRIEDVEIIADGPPAKPLRHSLHPPRRRRKKRGEQDSNEQQVVTPARTGEAQKAAQVTPASDQQDNYENIIMSGGCPRPVARNRSRPLPPPPPPPKKGKIQQRYRKQQQSGQTLVNEQNGIEATVVSGEVGSPEGAGPSGPTPTEHHPASHPSAPGRVGSKRRGAARLENDINENLKTIESSFATLDTVLKSLQTYSRSSPPRTVVKGLSEEQSANIIVEQPVPAPTAPPASPAGLTASPTVASRGETLTASDTSRGVSVFSSAVTPEPSGAAPVKPDAAGAVNKETVLAASKPSGADNPRLLPQEGASQASDQSQFKSGDVPQEISRFEQAISDTSDIDVCLEGEAEIGEQQGIAVRFDVKGVTITPVKDEKDRIGESEAERKSANPKPATNESIKDPEKVQTVPQTAVKFQEGKTVFETAVKIGENPGAAQHAPVKSDTETDVRESETLRDVTAPRQPDNPKQTEGAVQDPEKVPTVPQTALKFQEGKILFETTVKVGDEQPVATKEQPRRSDNPDHHTEQPDSTKQQPGNPQQPEKAVQDPEKVPTVPQTSLKLEEGKTLFETTVKVGDEQPAVTAPSAQQLKAGPNPGHNPAEKPENPSQPPQQPDNPKQPEKAVQDPEKVPTVPQTALKFQEGKTLFETTVKVGDEQPEVPQQPAVTKQPFEQPESTEQPPREPKEAVKDPEKVQVVPQTSLKFEEGKTLFETTVKVREDDSAQQPKSTEEATKTPEGSEKPPTEPKESVVDPVKVPTVPQTLVKFQEGKTLFETAVKIGDDQPGSLEQPADSTAPPSQQQPEHPPKPAGEPKEAPKDPEKVPTVPQTSLKFEEGKTLFETTVKVGDDQTESPQQLPKTESTRQPVEQAFQQPESVQQPPQQPESLQQLAEQAEGSEKPPREPKEDIKDPEKVPTVPQTSLKFEEGKTLFETTVKVGDDQPESPQQSAVPEGVQQPVSTEQPSREPKESVKDPEKVPTVPQTSLKFQEGKTLFETAVKIGDDEGTAGPTAAGSDLKTELTETQQPDSSQQTSRQSGETEISAEQPLCNKQPERPAQDPEVVPTVPQTSLKFQEGKTLFETSVKVGDEQPVQQPESSQKPAQQLEHTEQPVEKSEGTQRPPKVPKETIKDPEKVPTVPLTSFKFQEGKTLFETAVKIGDEQPASPAQPPQQAVDNKVPPQQVETSQQPAQQTETQQPPVSPQEPEKVPVVPQTALKFQEGKTLFETTVKVGDDQAAAQTEVSSEAVQSETQAEKTKAAAARSGGAPPTPAKGKTVYETLFQIDAIKRSKPTEAATKSEAASDQRKQEGSAEISGGAAGEVGHPGRAGGGEQPASTELQEGVADLASRLQGIRSTLESAICNISPALTPAPVPASASPTLNTTAQAAATPAEERPPSPASSCRHPSKPE